MELELDDDVFFADISKQISLLIMDDDEHFNPAAPTSSSSSSSSFSSSSSSSSSSSLSVQGLFRGGYQTVPYMYNQEQSKGTGVFIPKSSQPRRRRPTKQGRLSSLNAKQQQPLHQNRPQYHENSIGSVTTYNNNNKGSRNTSNLLHASIPRKTYRDAASIYT